MTIDDGATLLPGTGHYYLNPTVNSAIPADPTAPASPWVDLGHTSLDAPFGLESEGGDLSVLGTWQNPSLRTATSTRTESVVFVAQQWDEATYKMYWGSNGSVTSGFFQVPISGTAYEATLFVVAYDGVEQVAFHFPKVAISRADNISFDPEALAGLPLRATILLVSGNSYMYQVSPKGDLTPAP